MFLTSSELEDFYTRCRSESAPQADSQLEAVAQAAARTLVGIDRVAADSNFVADIVVAAELVVDMAAVDTEAVAAGIAQRQDMDKRSSYVDC